MGKWEHLIRGLYDEAQKESKKDPLGFTQCIVLCAVADELAEANRLERIRLRMLWSNQSDDWKRLSGETLDQIKEDNA